MTKEPFPKSFWRAVKAVGVNDTARAMNCSRQNLYKWRETGVPIKRLDEVSDWLGIPKSSLRPMGDGETARGAVSPNRFVVLGTLLPWLRGI